MEKLLYFIHPVNRLCGLCSILCQKSSPLDNGRWRTIFTDFRTVDHDLFNWKYLDQSFVLPCMRGYHSRMCIYFIKPKKSQVSVCVRSTDGSVDNSFEGEFTDFGLRPIIHWIFVPSFGSGRIRSVGCLVVQYFCVPGKLPILRLEGIRKPLVAVLDICGVHLGTMFP